MDSYYNFKYIKYHTKYKTLKNKLNINQLGGTKFEDILINDFIFDITYPTTKTTYKTDKGNEIHLITITLNTKDEQLPVLFVVPGMSHKSFLGTSLVVLSKLNELKTKFKKIYLLEYASFKKNQEDACTLRDEYKINQLHVSVYKPEYLMNREISTFINDNIITQLHLNNIHLLGKCNGAWIVTLLLLANENCKALYLAVPGIPPIDSGIQKLNDLTVDRIKNIKFVFGWTKQDIYPFHWGKSSAEKEVYDNIMSEIAKKHKIQLNFISEMYDNNCVPDPSQFHELYSEMISTIIKQS